MKFEPQQPPVLIAAFYEFFDLVEPEVLQSFLQTAGEKARVQGTVLLAPEGLNGTLAGAAEPLRRLLDELRVFCSDHQDESGENGIRQIGPTGKRQHLSNVKFSEAPTQPFRRFRVRIKAEIVTFRQKGVDPLREAGQYVPPCEWNALIERNDVRVIDVRNDYELAIGTFSGAEDPNTENFTDFAQYVEDNLDTKKDENIALFCTGGIRCEKATSYLLSKGFQDVFHLEGGILGYLRDTPEDDSRWQGECYVFDERVSLDHALAPGTFRNCAECGWPAKRGTDCPKCDASDANC